MLHIFESRYKQLLKDVEEERIPFGIYFQGKENYHNIGIMVELVDILKRYPGGELDIKVRANRVFKLEWFFDKLNDKLYPGGEVIWVDYSGHDISEEVFIEYSRLVALQNKNHIVELRRMSYEVAAALKLSSKEKLRFIQLEPVEQEKVLMSHIQLHTAIAQQENDEEYNFNLN